MNKFDISFYGNLIVDTVCKVDDYVEGGSNKLISKYTSLGASANLIREMISLNPKGLSISIDSSIGNDENGSYCKKWLINSNKLNSSKITPFLTTSHLPTSNALIIADTNKKTRSSIVQWGACTAHDNFTNHDSKWKHFLYIDAMTKIDEEHLKFLSNCSIVSVDFCLSNHTEEQVNRIYSMLKYVDYIFISDVEAMSITGMKNLNEISANLANKSRGYCILHTPKGSHISDGNTTNEVKTEFLNDTALDVLGAGDVFCASFIDYAMKFEKENVLQSAKFAHENTTKYLLNNKGTQNG